jgi:hypothetical protein
LSVVCLTVVLYLSCGSLPSTLGGQATGRMTAFAGGKFEASGVAGVPGTDGILFVDDGRPGEVFWMRLDQGGKQVGSVKAVRLGVSVEDLEGITTDGTHFYVVGSQSKPKGADAEGLVRFKFDAERQAVAGVEAISGLKSFLLEKVAGLREAGGSQATSGGLNIEGLAWDPRRSRLLLGLRSPVIDGQALVVPLRLRDPRGLFSAGNLEVADPGATRLPLRGAGVRSIEFDGQANIFRLIAGAAGDKEQTDFGLWEWSGEEGRPLLREATRFDRKLKPEGVARVSAGSRDLTLLVFDASGYTVLD